MICTLIDTDAGNLIGTYATEQEALAVIRGAIAAYGPEYARRAQALPLSI